MRAWNYSLILAQIERQEEAGCVLLQPASFALFVTALSAMDCRRQWRDAGEELSAEVWDELEGYITQAYRDLTIREDCAGTTMKYCQLAHIEEKNTNGGSAVVGSQTRPLNTIEYDPDGLISSLTTSNFKVSEAGTYLVTIQSSTWNTGATVLLFYDAEDYSYLAQSEASEGYGNVLVGIFDLVEDNWYQLLVDCATANAGDGLGHALNKGLHERYATVRLEKIG